MNTLIEVERLLQGDLKQYADEDTFVLRSEEEFKDAVRAELARLGEQEFCERVERLLSMQAKRFPNRSRELMLFLALDLLIAQKAAMFGA